MPIDMHMVDAFSDRNFGGNAAAVVLFERYPEDAVLQAIAAENNQSETAFPVPLDDGRWELRWFTPTVEVPLCGHATLASAYVLFNYVIPEAREIRFQTRQSGVLTVRRDGDFIAMDFPASAGEPYEDDLSPLFGDAVTEVRKTGAFTMAVLRSADDVRAFPFDRDAILALDRAGLIITAPGDGGYDCVSRFFTPAHGIDEDPVTGGAHTMIAPYWSNRLGRTEIRAWQASWRGGGMICRTKGDRVELLGKCTPYFSGTISL